MSEAQESISTPTVAIAPVIAGYFFHEHTILFTDRRKP